jgi:poly(3-hydroxybutyrate) depolymerase
VPFEGGAGDGLGGNIYPPADETMAVWRERNGCDSAVAPVVEVDGAASCTTWSCAVPTSLCTIEGWDHRWPGGVNAQAAGWDATAEAWAWFRSTMDPDPTELP